LLIFFPHFGSILQHVGTPRNGHARRKVLGYMKFFLSTYLQVYILHNPFNLYLLELPIRANLSFVCSKCFLYTFFSSFLAKQFVANPQPVPDCGPGATPPAFAGVTEPEVSAIRSRSLSQESPAAVALPPQPRSGLRPSAGNDGATGSGLRPQPAPKTACGPAQRRRVSVRLRQLAGCPRPSAAIPSI
jgi:hypothetical protein